MAIGATIFRIRIDVSDIDRGVYENLELRVAQHPSEDTLRLVTRCVAYCLAYEQDIAWGKGLGEAEEPPVCVKDPSGRLRHWIDIGVPSADRMHKASKAADSFTIVCHKPSDGLIRERQRRRIHRAEEVAVWLLCPKLVAAAAERLERNSAWTLVRTGEDLMLTVGEETLSGTLRETTLTEL